MHDGVLAESGGAQKVVDGLAVLGKPGLAVGEHDGPVRVDSQQAAHVALLGLAMHALLAFSHGHRQHVVSRLHVRHAFSHALNDPAHHQPPMLM